MFMTAASQTANSSSASDTYVFHDSHFHLTNYVQKGTDIKKYLEIMGDKVGRSTLFGANAYKKLPPDQQMRLDPMITGFNPADMYAADHIRRVLETFPGVFTGIGEFSIHKEFVSSKVAGNTASLSDPALDRILEFAGEVGLVVILHNVVATKLDRHLSYGGSLTWRPTTGEFGPRAAFGDFESHQKLATQFGVAYTNSREQRFSENNTKPDNTSIRLADSLNVFDIDAFADGTTVSQVDYQLYSANAGMKYKGLWLQAEGYFRILDNFIADGPMPLRTLQDKGFYVQGSYMVVPKTVEVYGATSKVFSRFGRPWEVIAGGNYYPFKNRNFRLNLHVVNVSKSPVSSTFGYYTGGLKGWSMTAGSSILF